MLLPAVLRFNEPAIAAQVAPMAQAMGLKDTSFTGLHSGVCALLDAVDIPRRLTDIGVPESCVARIAEKALHDSAAATNPRSATASEIEGILLDALTHGR